MNLINLIIILEKIPKWESSKKQQFLRIKIYLNSVQKSLDHSTIYNCAKAIEMMEHDKKNIL